MQRGGTRHRTRERAARRCQMLKRNGLKRGVNLDPATREALSTEMRRRKLNGSWIVRDALEKRYGIGTDLSQTEEVRATGGPVPEKPTDIAVATLAITPEKTVHGAVMHVPAPVATEIDVPGKVPDIDLSIGSATPPIGTTVAQTTGSTATSLVISMPRTVGATSTVGGIVAMETSMTSTGTSVSTVPGVTTSVESTSVLAASTIGVTGDDQRTGAGPGRDTGREATTAVRIRVVPAQNPKAVRLRAHALHERELLAAELLRVGEERHQAEADALRLRAEVVDLRAQLEQRELEHAECVRHQPQVVAGTDGHAYVIVPASDAMNQRIQVAARIYGFRVK
jgi:hypothetical protein